MFLVTINSLKRTKLELQYGPIHTNAFSKVSVFISKKTEQHIFIPTSVFAAFPLSYPHYPFSVSSDDESVFISMRFILPTPETRRFQNDTFTKGSTFDTVFESLRFHQRFRAFSVDERRKRIKMYVFSNENALVWMVPVIDQFHNICSDYALSVQF